MKLNVTQAEILANEIRNRILEQKNANVSQEVKQEIQQFIDETSTLSLAIKTLKEEIDVINDTSSKLEENFCKKMNLQRFYRYDNIDVESILKKILERSSPSTQEIKSKIIMKSLFGSEQEMQEFLAALVREYTR